MAVAQKQSGGADEKQLYGEAKSLAGLIEAFCVQHMRDAAPPLFPSTEAAGIDQMIDRHIEELRTKEETRLAENLETLCQLHDRLQLRKARRLRREFYAFASEDKLANLVLELLDEELADGSKGTLT